MDDGQDVGVDMEVYTGSVSAGGVTSPFLGELWGEVGGEESWEEALEMASSVCLRCLSLASSDKDKIFFKP